MSFFRYYNLNQPIPKVLLSNSPTKTIEEFYIKNTKEGIDTYSLFRKSQQNGIDTFTVTIIPAKNSRSTLIESPAGKRVYLMNKPDKIGSLMIKTRYIMPVPFTIITLAYDIYSSPPDFLRIETQLSVKAQIPKIDNYIGQILNKQHITYFTGIRDQSELVSFLD